MLGHSSRPPSRPRWRGRGARRSRAPRGPMTRSSTTGASALLSWYTPSPNCPIRRHRVRPGGMGLEHPAGCLERGRTGCGRGKAGGEAAVHRRRSCRRGHPLKYEFRPSVPPPAHMDSESKISQCSPEISVSICMQQIAGKKAIARSNSDTVQRGFFSM